MTSSLLRYRRNSCYWQRWLVCGLCSALPFISTGQPNSGSQNLKKSVRWSGHTWTALNANCTCKALRTHLYQVCWSHWWNLGMHMTVYSMLCMLWTVNTDLISSHFSHVLQKWRGFTWLFAYWPGKWDSNTSGHLRHICDNWKLSRFIIDKIWIYCLVWYCETFLFFSSTPPLLFILCS